MTVTARRSSRADDIDSVLKLICAWELGRDGPLIN